VVIERGIVEREVDNLQNCNHHDSGLHLQRHRDRRTRAVKLQLYGKLISCLTYKCEWWATDWTHFYVNISDLPIFGEKILNIFLSNIRRQIS
jgi:hypothetical protein